MGQLIVFRAIQGLGGGGLMVTAQAIIGDVVSPRERGRYMGYFGAVFGGAMVAGPLAGGFFTDHLTWRWVFYINLPLGLAALVVTTVALHAREARVRHRIDYPGAALLAAGVACVVLLTTWGGTEYAWGSSTIVGLDGRVIRVEVDVAPGLPGFTIVGLADAALQEARERTRGARPIARAP